MAAAKPWPMAGEAAMDRPWALRRRQPWLFLVQDIAAAEVKNEGMKTVDNSSYQPNFEAKRLS